MLPDDKPVLVYATFPALEAAEKAAAALLDARQIACANLIPGMVALYVWEGRRQRDSEVVMIAKTRASLAEAALATLRANHPYTNPAMVVIPIVGGAKPFLDWIAGETGA